MAGPEAVQASSGAAQGPRKMMEPTMWRRVHVGVNQKEKLRMVKKRCPDCDQDSYSAVVTGKWLCPYCEADITLVEPENISEAKAPKDTERKPLPFRLFNWSIQKIKSGNVPRQM